MRALILAGGKGTRLEPLTHTITKQLLPVANKPILFYIMDMVREAGITDVGVVVSNKWGAQVEQALGNGSRWNCQITYIVQHEPAGLAHAVKVSRSFLANSLFLMVLGDNIYKFAIKDFVTRFEEQNLDALLLLKEVDKPSGFGIAELDSDEQVIRVQEKPEQPRSNLALAGVYLFSPLIHEAIDAIKPSRRGELEITDAIQKLVEMKRKVRGHILEGWWLDTGDKDDLLKANCMVLAELLKKNIQGRVDANSQIIGKVEIGKGSVIEHSEIHGPASIAEDCLIKGSYVGSFTSIGKGTTVEDSSIEKSLILENCYIQNIDHLVDTLIGSKVRLIKHDQVPKAVRLFVGDDAKIEV